MSRPDEVLSWASDMLRLHWLDAQERAKSKREHVMELHVSAVGANQRYTWQRLAGKNSLQWRINYTLRDEIPRLWHTTGRTRAQLLVEQCSNCPLLLWR